MTPISDPISASMYWLQSSDPDGELIDRSNMAPEDIAQIGELMQALSGLREAEQRMAEASERYMKLSTLDMRALHYLIVAKNRGLVVTPGMVAAHLDISAASTTKLLNRLEEGEHVIRQVHPEDRRAFSIEVTQETRTSAMQTVGRQHAKRFYAAARLTRDERETVIRFLTDMTKELALDDAGWDLPDDSA